MISIKILLYAVGWVMLAELIRFYALVNPKIYTVKSIKNNKYKYFLFAGMTNQPNKAFCFMEDLGGELNYVMYSNYGFSPKLVARGVASRIQEFESDELLVLMGISLGDQTVSKLLENKVMEFFPNTRTYSINPCTGKEFLAKEELKKIRLSRMPLLIFAILLGPLSFIPVIPSDGGLMSFRLLVDQIYYLGSAMSLSPKNSRDGVILSTDDEYLNNCAIMQKFDGAKLKFVNCQHARTIDKMDLYREAFNEISTEADSIF